MANWQLLPFYGNWLVYFPLSLDKTYDIFLAAQKVTQPVESVDPMFKPQLYMFLIHLINKPYKLITAKIGLLSWNKTEKVL